MENSMEARVSASKITFKHIYVNATLKLALFFFYASIYEKLPF